MSINLLDTSILNEDFPIGESLEAELFNIKIKYALSLYILNSYGFKIDKEAKVAISPEYSKRNYTEIKERTKKAANRLKNQGWKIRIRYKKKS